MPKLPSHSSYMIGSMPFDQPTDAIDLLKQFPLSIFSIPQLPRRSFKEAMIPQCSEGFPGITVDETKKKIFVSRDNTLIDQMTSFYETIVGQEIGPFAISAEYALGYHKALDSLYEIPRLEFIKGQVTGPFTFGLGLNDQDGKAVWFDEQYQDIVLKGLTAKGLWLTERLSQFADQVIISLDEPILSALGTPAYMGIQDEHVIAGLNEVIDALHVKGALVAVHCCGNMDWGLLAKTNLDIMSFDAFFYGDKVALYPDQINEFLARGGMMAWGIVPTGDRQVLANMTVDRLKDRKFELIDLFKNKGIDHDRLTQQMLFTPSCGMGNLSSEEAGKVMSLLYEIRSE